MELCIKTNVASGLDIKESGFNPCFNGTMYKNPGVSFTEAERNMIVSILVLMELCIKTISQKISQKRIGIVSILVLMELCIKTC